MTLKLVTLIGLVIGFTTAAIVPLNKQPAFSKETHLQIKNHASADIVDSTADISSSDDWENGEGVRGNGQGLTIASGSSVDLREEVDYFADSNYFTLTLYFSDQSSDTFTANLRSAIGDGDVDFQQSSGTHKFKTTKEVNGNTLLIDITDAALSDVNEVQKQPAFSKETHLQIKNRASTDIVDSTAGISDSGDWENDEGVRGNGQGLKITAGSSVDLREEVDYFADSNYFTLTLYFSDGSSDTFSANLRSAIGDGDTDFKQSTGKHRFQTTSEVNGNTLVIDITDPSSFDVAETQ